MTGHERDETLGVTALLVRLGLGGLILLCAAVTVVALNDGGNRNEYSPVLSRLDATARQLPQDAPLRRMGQTSINWASDLSETATILSAAASNAPQAKNDFVITTKEIEKVGIAALERLRCAPLECQGIMWALPKAGEKAGPKDILITALRERFLEGIDGGKRCMAQKELRAVAGYEAIESDLTDAEQARKWLRISEPCRRTIERAGRRLENQALEERRLIDGLLKQLESARAKITEEPGLNTVHKLADAVNRALAGHLKTTADRISVCTAGKVVAASYFRRTTSPTLVNNQKQAAAMIAVGLGLSQCDERGFIPKDTYQWALDPKDLKQELTEEQISAAKERFGRDPNGSGDGRGGKAIPTKCDTYQKGVECTAGRRDVCDGLMLFRGEGETIDIVAVALNSVLASIDVSKLNFTEAPDRKMKAGDVTGLLCDGRGHLAPSGRILVGLEEGGKAPLYVYETDEAQRWDAHDFKKGTVQK